jgi:surface protein
VLNMWRMFMNSQFSGDISKWDVSSVTVMDGMFFDNSQFNGDISKWDVSSVTEMENMFMGSKISGDISGWDVSKVTDVTTEQAVRMLFFKNGMPEENWPKFDV